MNLKLPSSSTTSTVDGADFECAAVPWLASFSPPQGRARGLSADVALTCQSGSANPCALVAICHARHTTSPRYVVQGFAMIEGNVNASLAPPEGTDELRDYLDAVKRALDVRSDADLARILEVPPATFASWKSRGAVPTAYARWFEEELPSRLFHQWRYRLPLGGRMQVASTLRALRALKAESSLGGDWNSALLFGGLAAISGTLMSKLGEPVEHDVALDAIAGVLVDAVHKYGSAELT